MRNTKSMNQMLRHLDKQLSDKKDCVGCQVIKTAAFSDTPPKDAAAVGYKWEWSDEFGTWHQVVDKDNPPPPKKPVENPAVHYFRDSSAAYNLTQTKDDIHDGDVLVCKKEKSIGVLYEAWPVFVFGGDVGVLERLKPEVKLDTMDGGKYAKSYALAKSTYDDMLKINFDFSGGQEDPFINEREDSVNDKNAALRILTGLSKIASELETTNKKAAELIDTAVEILVGRIDKLNNKQ